MTTASALFEPRLIVRRRRGRIFAALCLSAAIGSVIALMTLLATVFREGWSWLTPHFLTNFPSQIFPEMAGIKSAIAGTLALLFVTIIVAVPVGVGTAIYLEEYATRSRLTDFIQLNIANLAGVPSIVYGILGLAAFVRLLELGPSVLAGGLTMSLLVLPVIIIAAREAIAAVPPSIRAASYALGATRWQTVRAHVLPAAIPGIMTGVILALSRAIGEAAPLIVIGGVTYVAFLPAGLKDPFTVLPIQIYGWSEQPIAEFRHLAAAGILVLLGILIPMNGLAIGIRAWRQRKRAS
jgi:phosphate transport system permease protein